MGTLHQATPCMPHAHRLSAGVNGGSIPDLSAPKSLALTSCQKSQCALGPESGGASEHTAEKASSGRGWREVVPCCRGWFGKRWKVMLDSVPCRGGEVTSSLHRCRAGKSTNLSIPQCDKQPLRPYVLPSKCKEKENPAKCCIFWTERSLVGSAAVMAPTCLCRYRDITTKIVCLRWGYSSLGRVLA